MGEHHAQRVVVVLDARRVLVRQLFGGSESGGAAGQMEAVQRRDAEVDDAGAAVPQHDVARGQIAHDHSAPVQGVQRVAEGGGQPGEGAPGGPGRVVRGRRQHGAVALDHFEQMGAARIGGHQELVVAVREMIEEARDTGHGGACLKDPPFVAQPCPDVGSPGGLADVCAGLLDDQRRCTGPVGADVQDAVDVPVRRLEDALDDAEPATEQLRLGLAHRPGTCRP